MRFAEKKLNVLVTGASGYIGRLLVKRLAGDDQLSWLGALIATDIALPRSSDRRSGVEYEVMDVRNPALEKVLRKHQIDVVIHLAAIVTPGKKSCRELEHSVDVLGTKNVLECSLAAGVTKLVTTSSGAAYGYYADNPEWFDEEDELRGNVTFAYSDHKRQVEEMLAEWRASHPELRQLIFRPGTVLGASTSNQITALFEKPWVIGISDSDSPFVIIWDEDVVSAIIMGVRDERTGIFNLAGDGVLTLREMASMMGKPYIELPVSLITPALKVLRRLRLTQYGSEQVDFLRYRPVLSNRRLREELGYEPEKTTREVFVYYLENRANT